LVNRFDRVSIYTHSSLHDSTEISSTISSIIGMKIAPGSTAALSIE
jgi:hypothetical protein